MLKRYNLNNIFYLVALFILLAVFLIYPLDLNIYWDQSVYLLHGKYFAGFDIGYDELIFRSPFLSLLTAPLWLFTYKIIHFKLISLLFSFYFLFISYLYLKEISKKQIALISVILLFSSGLFHFETRFFLTDIPSLSFFISSLYFTEKKLKNSSNFILAGVFLSLMILTRLGMLYFVPLVILYVILKSKQKNDLIYFGLSSLIVYLPYGLWIFFNYGSFFENIFMAKTEGYNNASYSFLKFNQIYYTIGIFPLFLSLFSIKKIKKVSVYLSWLVLFITFFIIPYNPENNRFLIPALPFLFYLIVIGLNELKNKYVLYLFVTLLCIEHLYKFNLFRSKLNFHGDEKTIVELIVEKIPKGTQRIYTNFLYPEIAFRSELKTIVPKLYGHEYKDFKFIDKAILTKPGLVITNTQDDFSPSYLNGNKNFKVIDKVKDFYFIQFFGHQDINSKQLKLFWLRNKWDKKAKGKGFLEININKIKNFNFTYYPNIDFINEFKLSECLEDSSQIIFSNPKDFKTNIQTQSNSSIWVEFLPKKIGSCPYNGAAFLLRFDYLKL